MSIETISMAADRLTLAISARGQLTTVTAAAVELSGLDRKASCYDAFKHAFFADPVVSAGDFMGRNITKTVDSEVLRLFKICFLVSVCIYKSGIYRNRRCW